MNKVLIKISLLVILLLAVSLIAIALYQESYSHSKTITCNISGHEDRYLINEFTNIAKKWDDRNQIWQEDKFTINNTRLVFDMGMAISVGDGDKFDSTAIDTLSGDFLYLYQGKVQARHNNVCHTVQKKSKN